MWWKAALAGPLEMSLVMRPVEAAIATDASDIGLGAVLDAALPHTGELFVDGESGERGAQVKENLLPGTRRGTSTRRSSKLFSGSWSDMESGCAGRR